MFPIRIKFICLVSLAIVVSILLLPGPIFCQNSEEEEPPESPVLSSQHHSGYRKVNWCVTGWDEPELHQWPYSQFVPLLRAWNREVHDPLARYDLRFYDINAHMEDIGNRGLLYKTMHVVFKAEKRKNPKHYVRDVWEPEPLEGLIIQANSNPYSLALPTGQFFPPGGENLDPKTTELHCKDCEKFHGGWARQIACRKRAKIHVEHPTILAWHFMQPSFNESEYWRPAQPLKDEEFDIDVLPPPPQDIRTSGRQTEVHANFRFYSPSCSPVRRLMFTILAVRSFVNHKFDIFHRGPYEVTIRDQLYQSDIFPTPYFHMHSQRALCHTTSSTDITLEHPQKFKEFEMNHYFDCCVREEVNWKTDITVELLDAKDNLTTSCEEKLYKKQTGRFDPRTIALKDARPVCFFPFLPKVCDDYQTENAIIDYPACAPCRTPATTTTERVTEKPYSIYKRTVHGGLMIMTNFCLQPIVIYIARFYKETFNSSKFKGAKSWYMMHLIGGFVSSSMVYIGYFSGGDQEAVDIQAHIAIGKVYIITLGVCYITAWGRNKNNFITVIAEFIHGCLGYVTITLALYSIWSAPGMEFTSKLFVVLMVCSQAFFMIILTCQICILDRRFGMKPKRRHFPTVEARFDEVPVPGSKFRIIMLILFSLITFSLSTASTFFD